MTGTSNQAKSLELSKIHLAVTCRISDIKRPSSASRLTPERRSMQEKASMVGKCSG